MSNTRFGVVNAVVDAAILNGDTIGPDRSEISPYVMEKVQNGDRCSFWVPGAANANGGLAWELVLSWGFAKTFSMAAALGVEQDGIATVKVGYYASYPTGWTQAASLARNGRDWGGSFTAATGEPWSFLFTGTLLQSVSGLFLAHTTGNALVDLGVVGLPNFSTNPFRARTEHPQADFSVVLNDDGRMGHEFEMEFFARDLTELAKYEALINVGGTLVLLDRRDRCFEVIITGGKLPTRPQQQGYRVTLSMQRMP